MQKTVNPLFVQHINRSNTQCRYAALTNPSTLDWVPQIGTKPQHKNFKSIQSENINLCEMFNADADALI